jgi:L-asparaginase
MNKSILLIYTGGTIGMIKTASGSLQPFNFDNLKEQIPELAKIKVQLKNVSIKNPIDSSNMDTNVWIEIAQIIESNYSQYDGFVILHGSDTMAYTASCLSFMLQNLAKPIILTGSQLPIGIARTDARENLITSIELACEAKNPEVCIYFEYKLMRGNRSTKINANNFEAFESPNFPILAQAGVSIDYTTIDYKAISEKLIVQKKLDSSIAIIKLFPGIQQRILKGILEQNAKAVIIESFGSGNLPNEDWFIDLLKEAIAKQKIIVNITQCLVGSVTHGMYETSSSLEKIGLISGKDMTIEAATTKLMTLLAQDKSTEEVKTLFKKSLAGEMS